MAISPRSKGLGNIGNIVNRQGMAAPTRPVAKAPVRPVAKAPVPKPVTTTFAQRKAAPSPFRSATKPVAKVNPMANQPTGMPFNPFGGSPIQQAPVVDPGFGVTPGQIGQPGLPWFPGAGPEPMPLPIDQFIRPEVGRDQGEVQREVEAIMNRQGPGNVNFGGNTGMPTFAPTQGPISDPMAQFYNQQGPGGIFGGNLPNMVGNTVTGNLGQLFGGLGTMLGNAGQQAIQQSDYDQLEGSSFNTNPSNSGSLFGGGGFATY